MRSLGKNPVSKKFPLTEADIEPAKSGYHAFLYFASALHHHHRTIDVTRRELFTQRGRSEREGEERGKRGVCS